MCDPQQELAEAVEGVGYQLLHIRETLEAIADKLGVVLPERTERRSDIRLSYDLDLSDNNQN